MNTYFAQLEVKTGLCDPITIAQDLGVHKATGGDLDQVPAFVLGRRAGRSAQRHGRVRRNGQQRHVLHAAVDHQGHLAGRRRRRRTAHACPGPNCKQVLDPTIAEGVTTLLAGRVAKGGTGCGLALGRPAAGKTGTDDEFKNAWFSGYTPNLASSVWVGNPDSTMPMRAITVNNKNRRGLRRDAARADLAARDEGCAGQPTDPKLPIRTGRRVARRADHDPRLAGQDPVDAAATLTEAGPVSPHRRATQVTSSQPPGKVDTTVPAAGTSVYAGQSVKMLDEQRNPAAQCAAHRHSAGVVAARRHPIRLCEPIGNHDGDAEPDRHADTEGPSRSSQSPSRTRAQAGNPPEPYASWRFTSAATRPPSARPATSGFTTFMTAPIACGPLAPDWRRPG